MTIFPLIFKSSALRHLKKPKSSNDWWVAPAPLSCGRMISSRIGKNNNVVLVVKSWGCYDSAYMIYESRFGDGLVPLSSKPCFTNHPYISPSCIRTSKSSKLRHPKQCHWWQQHKCRQWQLWKRSQKDCRAMAMFGLKPVVALVSVEASWTHVIDGRCPSCFAVQGDSH